MRFALAPSARRLETVGRHLIVFDGSSWDTHVLNEAAGVLLRATAEAPRTVTELTVLLEDLLTEPERVHARANVQGTVEQLCSLGLVVAVEA